MGRANRDRGVSVKVTVRAEFKLFGVIKHEGKWYIASCPPLDLTTQGRTEEEAKKNLVEASQLFIISCLERGTLDQALKELGFVPLKAGPENIPAGAFPLAVPIPFSLEKSLSSRV
jgi:predicted RNase H-like HicB family nuclease